MLVYVCEETVDSLLFLCHAANKLASLLRGEGRMGFRDIHPYWERVDTWELIEVFRNYSGKVCLRYGLQRGTQVEGSAGVKSVKQPQLASRQI